MGRDRAVFSSWMNHRAIVYRHLHNIPESWGTAVNVQAMVFGNMDDNSATGVAFTRNPSTGVRELYGEYLINAQGEDVVAGIRTPQPIDRGREPRLAGVEKISLEAAHADDLRGIRAGRRPARTPLPRHAGHGVHRRARQIMDAADARRQAHGARGAEARRRHGE